MYLKKPLVSVLIKFNTPLSVAQILSLCDTVFGNGVLYGRAYDIDHYEYTVGRRLYGRENSQQASFRLVSVGGNPYFDPNNLTAHHSVLLQTHEWDSTALSASLIGHFVEQARALVAEFETASGGVIGSWGGFRSPTTRVRTS